MEEGNQSRTFPSKQCQIEDCEEISVGSKVPLCRKHRNKTYKQNYKKKRRNAEAGLEENPQEIVIDDQYLLEQKYSNMLQDVLTQKQMELFESPSVVNLLKSYQTQKLITRNRPKDNGPPLSNFNTSEQSDNVEQRQQSEVLPANSSTKLVGNTQRINETVFDQSFNFSQCYIDEDEWDQNQSPMSSNTIPTRDAPLLYSTKSSSIMQPSSSGTTYVPADTTTFQGGHGFHALP